VPPARARKGAGNVQGDLRLGGARDEPAHGVTATSCGRREA
jgi:hypothetical protein